MDLEHLRTFRAVARTRSFTGAASALHYAQSTVSVHIRALEAEVGAALFDRLPQGVRLTEAGRRLVPLAERLLDLAAAAAQVAREEAEAEGELVVAAPETVVAHHLPAVLRCLRDRHPGLRVRLEGIAYHEVLGAIGAGQIDVGFLLQPPLRPTSSLALRLLRTEPLRMVVAPDHPLASPAADVAEELGRTTLLLTERGCGYRPLLEAHLDRAGVRPGHTLELDSVEAIRRCAEAGLGVALVPQAWVADPLAAGDLVAMDWFAPRLGAAVQLAWHPARWRGAAFEAFLAAAESCLAAADGGGQRPLPRGGRRRAPAAEARA